MMTGEEIQTYLTLLGEEMEHNNIKGEICLYGGAVMCLVYQARPSTKDIDAVFQPAHQMRDAARRIASRFDLSEDWLNDGVKDFLVQHPQRVYLNLPALKVYVPEPDYLLAMKTLAARVDATDREDVSILLRHLRITKPEEVFSILEKYYPNGQIRAATRFFVEELLQQ
ncbi:MAG TPA: hypothetical protein DCP63_09085 [Bacteroidetes bacterium]|nr:hypothetical protein [Bacteroidota bacterium]